MCQSELVEDSLKRTSLGQVQTDMLNMMVWLKLKAINWLV